jgi:hypothetical protein
LLELENVKQIAPLDITLGIDGLPVEISRRLMCDIADLAQATTSYEIAYEMYCRMFEDSNMSMERLRYTSLIVGYLSLENETLKAIEVFNKRHLIKWNEDKLDAVFYFETDGSFIKRRIEWLDKRFKEVKLGVFFTSNDIVKKTYKSGKSKGLTYGKIKNKDYVAHIGGWKAFSVYAVYGAIMNYYGNYKTKILLSDGAKWIKSMHDLYFPDFIHIIDLFHVLEKVGDCSFKIFGSSNEKQEERKNWQEKVEKAVKEYDLNTLFDSLEEYTDIYDVLKFRNYILRNLNSINYAEYKKNGWLCGSGAIEGANKSVTQERLKGANLRTWSLEDARYMLMLRVAKKSRKWKERVKDVIDNFDFRKRPDLKEVLKRIKSHKKYENLENFFDKLLPFESNDSDESEKETKAPKKIKKQRTKDKTATDK